MGVDQSVAASAERVDDFKDLALKTVEDYEKAFYHAAEVGDLDMMKSVEDRCPDGKLDYNAALVAAAKKGHVQILKWLTGKEDIDLDTCDGLPLLLSIMSESYDAVVCLVLAGADPYARDKEAIKKAVALGNMPITKFLVETSGEPVYFSDLFEYAASLGKLEIVQWFAIHGFDNHSLFNALRAAVKSGHLRVVEYLATLANLDLKDHDQKAIVVAAEKGHLNVVKWLASKGLEVTARGNSALILAATNGHLDTVKWLVANGADVTANNNEAIHAAERANHSEIARFLKDAMLKGPEAKR